MLTHDKTGRTEITIHDLSSNYRDEGDFGVSGYGGKLDIRPPYQREFIYKDKQRNAVINTVSKDFPLNVMYWAVREDGSYEVIDGQQRTISLCQYVKGDFSFENLYFHNLTEDKKKQFLDYKLMVYLCTGTDSEKLEWFRTINIAGEKLTEQELRNAVYSGSWVSDAKRYFSKRDCAAFKIAQDYLDGSAIRQEYLETVIDWISYGNIEDYMGKNQHEPDANNLWEYFKFVIDWVETTFPNKRKKIMKGVPWGVLYNQFKDDILDPSALEKEIINLIEDEEVTNQKGIFRYILTRDERFLSLRSFSDKEKQKVYERQKGKCPKCPKTKHWELEEMEADHITPWHSGGKTILENCQMLCKDHNRRKSGK